MGGPRASVRPARLGDIPRLALLERRSFACDRISAHDWRSILRRPRSAVLVLEDPRHGVCGLLAGERRGSELYVNSLAVDLRARRRGAAMTLLDAALKRARDAGCSLCTLEVRRDNLAAQKLYAKRGFRRSGAARAWYEDGADAWRLSRPIRT